MRRLIHGAIALATVACTADGLAPASYRGEPIGAVELLDRSSEIHTDPQMAVGIFWVVDRAPPLGFEALLPHPERARGAITDANFSLSLYDPPPAEVMLTLGTEAELAVGLIAAWRDTDGDGQRGADEPPVHIGFETAVIYSAEAVPLDRSPTGRPIPAGVSVVGLPLRCAPPPPTVPGDCGVPLGVDCTTDAECGAGVCFDTGPVAVEIRQCVVIEPPPDGCRPADGAFVPRFSPGVSGIYLPACTVDADCPEQQPCAPLHGACGGPPSAVGGARMPLALCIDDVMPPPSGMGRMGGRGMGGGRR